VRPEGEFLILNFCWKRNKDILGFVYGLRGLGGYECREFIAGSWYAIVASLKDERDV
jgi:hypothetical protein